MAQIQKSSLVWALTAAIRNQEKVEKKLNYTSDSCFLATLRTLLADVKAGASSVELLGVLE